MSARNTTVTMLNVDHVSVDYSGGQLVFDATDLPLRSSAGEIGLHQIAELFCDPDAWLEFDTEVEWVPNEDLQPWEVESRPNRQAVGRLYGRGVTAVLVALAADT